MNGPASQKAPAMSMTTCRVCGNAVAQEAEKCPHCGIKTPYKLNHRIKIGANILVVAGIAWLIFSGNAARLIGKILGGTIYACKVHDIEIKSDVFLSKGEFDAGYIITAIVEKTGKAGIVNLNYELSTSQGVWQKTKKFRLDPGKRYALDVGFPEPTIEATGISGRVNCDTK